MLGSGCWTSSMGTAWRYGLTEHGIAVSSTEGRSREKGSLTGLMVVAMLANSTIIILMALGSTTGQTGGGTRANGSKTKCTDAGNSPGPMVEPTTENTSMTKNTAMGNSIGLMGKYTREIG